MHLKKNSLEKLLKSLSNNELNYLSQYLGFISRKKTSNYIGIINDILDNKSEFLISDEKASKQAITIAKQRAYGHILQSLRLYHHEKSPQIIIQNMLSEIEILFDMGHLNQSIIIVNKAQRIAKKYEQYGLLLQILEWERRLSVFLDKPPRNNEDIAKEELEILEKVIQILELEKVFTRTKEIKRKNGYVKGKDKEELQKIARDNPIIHKSEADLSLKGKYYYHFIHALYYWMHLDHKNAYKHSLKLITPEISKIFPVEYFEGILENITCCVCLGYFEEALAKINIAKSYVTHKNLEGFKNYSIRFFYYESCYKLMIYIYTGNQSALLKQIEETQEKIKIYNDQISLEMKSVIYGNLKNAYIAINNIKEAERINNFFLLEREIKSVREDGYYDLYFI